ncbi:uncharacterized protein LOC106876528 [Octopus bimaculoides]|uniref:uncharacterized protein LOC106876528 n=1 Tax=Octopus bimaculoides TaxID=37653 RepID=UPI00071DE999|nr:uncharacterized protein LOC106876528 [Octopus bimaculoides]|eukprot:XP_014780597.1 PREDICTED: uncharacterized protein LOC106876528 [Octopus bimaculoides]
MDPLRKLSFWIVTLLTLGLSGIKGRPSLENNAGFDKSFQKFLKQFQYRGASVALMRQGKLLYTHGYGSTQNNVKMTPEVLFPASNISKLLTAVSVLKLVENGKVNLTAKVFGKFGILNHLRPWSIFRTDNRLYDITVDDLLRHAGGWDSAMPPMFDPVLNSIYLKNGYRIPNITSIMQLKNTAELKDIFRYMMSIPLNFKPGTKSVHSHLGYVILDQIIEKVQNYDYPTFVRKNILEPCGMWHTRFGKHMKENRIKNMVKRSLVGNFNTTYSLHLEREVVSLTDGWYTNVYDIMRFFRCLDHTGTHQLLKKSSIKNLLAKPRKMKATGLWVGANLNVNKNGQVCLEGDGIIDGMLLCHRNFLQTVQNPGNSSYMSSETFVMLLVGGHNKPLPIRNFMNYFTDWSQNGANYFSYDLADVRVGHVGVNEQIIKYKLSEHHISAYVNAIKDQYFKIEWINAFEYNRESYFSVISKVNPDESLSSYYLEHGLDEKSLLHFKHIYSKKNVYLSLLQSYISFSHTDKNRYVALFDTVKEEPVDIRFGIRQYSQCYKLFAQVYNEKGFVPRVQSFVHIDQEPQVCFILEKKPVKDYKEYIDISLKELTESVVSNAKAHRVMTYLDTSSKYKRPRFSVIFRKDLSRQGTFKSNVEMSQLEDIIADGYLKDSFFPRLITGYSDKKGTLYFAIYMERIL